MGQWSKYRNRKHGNSSKDILSQQLIVCIQNHDQIGNACSGLRLFDLVSLEKYLLASTILFFSPNIPLLFMGQEWNATTPFYYFTSFEDRKLGKIVSESYRKDTLNSGESIDPQNVKFFESSKLKWDEINSPEHVEVLHFYQKLIALRQKNKCLNNMNKDFISLSFDEEELWMAVHRWEPSDSQALLAVNFSEEDQIIHLQIPQGLWEIELSSSQAYSKLYFKEGIESSDEARTQLFIPKNTALIYLKTS